MIFLKRKKVVQQYSKKPSSSRPLIYHPSFKIHDELAPGLDYTEMKRPTFKIALDSYLSAYDGYQRAFETGFFNCLRATGMYINTFNIRPMPDPDYPAFANQTKHIIGLNTQPKFNISMLGKRCLSLLCITCA